jgi:hypothetical protein
MYLYLRLFVLFGVFLSACQATTPVFDVTMTAVSTPTSTITQTVTAVPSPTTIIETPFIPDPRPTQTPRPTPTKYLTPTPGLTEAPLVSQSWLTLTSQTHGFSLQYPPGWTPVTTLPNRVSLVREGTGIALRLMVRHATEDVNLVRSGVAAGSFIPRDPVNFLGQPISSEVLVNRDKAKAVFYERAAEITRGDLVFVITLESNRLDYEAIVIPQDVQAEADAIVASVELITGDMPSPETTDLTLLYNQRGRLFRFDLSSLVAEPFILPGQDDVRDALLGGNGRYLAFTNDAGLNLYDIVNEENQIWLSGSTDPWKKFVPRAWNSAGDLLVQHIWGTDNTTPGWVESGDNSWRLLPLPDGVTAEYYGLDSGVAWAPDGIQLALGGYDYAIPSNVPGLTIINLGTDTAQRIITRMIASGIKDSAPLVAGVYDPAWSPDGTWIAFGLEEDATEPLDFPVRLYLVRPDGAGLAPLTDNTRGRATHPLWTAGDSLYYSMTGVSDAFDGIHVYDLAAKTDSLLIPGSDLVPINFSPDEKFLVYRQTRREGGFIYQDLMIWSIDTGQSMLVAEGRSGDPARFVGWQLDD